MFPPKPPATNSTSLARAFPFSFTMGPLTIYPLFLLPLIFWISPISSDAITARSDQPDKDLKLHTGYTESATDQDILDIKPEETSFYANQPLNLQTPQKDRYYSPPPPVSYYPSPYYPYQSVYSYYPSPNSFSYPNMNPYLAPSPYSPAPYQSHFYDPYVQLMHLSQPPKYQHQPQAYQSALLPQSPQISSLISQPSHHMYQSGQPMNYPYFSGSGPQKPNQILSSLQQNEPQTIVSQFSPDDAYTLYSSLSPGGTEHVSYQSTSGSSHGQAQTSPSNYQHASSSVFSSLSPNTQQLLGSLTNQKPFGKNDKQSRNPNEDITDIAKNPPPKAIMTTASDILGLRGHTTPNFSFHYTPDAHKLSLQKYVTKTTQQYKNKPPTYSFNPNKQANYQPGLDLQIPKNYKLKTANETLDPGPDCENCEDPAPNFISEPIISASVLTSPHGGIDEYIEAVLAKSKKKSVPQPHNILPDDEPVPQMHGTNTVEEDPTPLFVTGDEEDSEFFAQRDPIPEHDRRSQIYVCPMSRDLREISQAEIYPDPIKCDQFYYCKSGRAYIFKCPVNHFFNPYSNICERDEDYACAMTLSKKK